MRTAGSLRNAFLLLVACSASVGACNLITGVNDLQLEDDLGGGANGGTAGSSGDGGTRPSTGGAGGTGGASTTTGSAGAAGTMTTNLPVDASGVTITQIAIYQGVKETLMMNGQAADDGVPIVAGRDALVRVWLNTDSNYDGQPVTAHFYIKGSDSIIYEGPVPANPDDGSLGSTLNFNVPGASITAGMQFGVDILQPFQPSKGANPGAHYPADGYAQTNTINVGASLKVVIVPIAYGADGSNRLPDTSPQMMQGYKDLFYAMYPAPAIDITVRSQPVQYNQQVASNGSGWDQLLGYLGEVRQQDNAAFDVYYYGAFSPAAGVGQYCGGGCVAGLGNIGGVNDSYSRAAIGLGFSDDGGAIAWETAVHEIGHTHGRYHSPCGGAAGADPNYPYQNAIIGKWGYNLVTQQLYEPNSYTDVMGYCQPIWVSDFTFNGFMQRIKAVNNANIVVPQDAMNLTYDRARVDMQGNVVWDTSIKMQYPPQAPEQVDLSVQTAAGAKTVKGHFYRYDHLPGGMLLWPQAGGPASAVAFTLDGAQKSASR